MSQIKLLGCRRTGRYPRWGYLDRYDTNPYLMPALLASVALGAFLLAGWMAWKHLRAAPVGVIRVEAPPPPEIMPPPSILTAQEPGGAIVASKPVLPTPPEFTLPKPVPDELAWVGDVPDARVGAPGLEGAPDIPRDPVAIPFPNPVSPTVYIPVEKQPELVFMEAPIYPELAREAGVSGEVIVRVFVDERGDVTRAFVVQGVPLLDAAALAAARTAVFKPALQSGQPVGVWMNIPISFELFVPR